MLDIWKRVKLIMDELRITHADVESAIQVSSSQLSAWINNDRYPRADIAMRLAKYLHVSIDWLLTGEDEKAVRPEVLVLLRNKSLMDIMARIAKLNIRQVNAVVTLLDAFDV